VEDGRGKGMNLASLAKILPTDAEPIVLDLIGRIEKHRALEDDESRLVEALVRKEKRRGARVKHVWTKQEDASLLKASKMRGGVRMMAERMGMQQQVLWARLHRLRNSLNGAAKRKKVEG